MDAVAEATLNLFWDVNAGRTSNGFGLNALTFLDLWAYSQLTGVELTPWQVDQIKTLDREFLSAFEAAPARQQKK